MSPSILGLYLGIIIDQKYLSSGQYPYIYNTDPLMTVKRLVVIATWGVPCVLPMALIGPDDGSFWYITICRNWLPAFFSYLYIFGFSKSIAIYFGTANLTKYEYEGEPFE